MKDCLTAWHIGTCLICGSDVFQMSDPELNNPDIDFKDYFIYCSNIECVHHIGQRVYDDYQDTDLGWLKWLPSLYNTQEYNNV